MQVVQKNIPLCFNNRYYKKWLTRRCTRTAIPLRSIAAGELGRYVDWSNKFKVSVMPGFLILFLATAVILLSSCTKTMKDKYESLNHVYPNTLPTSGIKSNYSSELGFTNLEEMKDSLNKNNKFIFSRSISWYATEAEFSFAKINKKTAREIVDIVNCLKINRAKPLRLQSSCFEQIKSHITNQFSRPPSAAAD